MQRRACPRSAHRARAARGNGDATPFRGKRRLYPFAAFALCALLLTVGCAAREPVAAKTGPTAETVSREWGPLQLVLYKGRRTLVLYRYGELVKQYPVSLGFKPEGDKRFIYDARTPEGYYRITDKRPHPRWQYFLEFDYPNAWDRRRYAENVAAGTVPELNGEPFGIGGNLGIHGSDKPEAQSNGQDWTKGCIAMSPDDIRELHESVEIGTPLWLLE